MKKTSFLIICIVILMSMSVFLILNEPLIILNGREEIILNLNDDYKEAGYTGKTRLKKMNGTVKVSNNINNKKIGEYEVEYKLTYLFNTKKIKRKVTVIDNIKPEIKLKGKKELVMCPNEEYKEEGYEITDNYDEDINKKVKIKRTKKEIIYRVRDSSGNEDIKIRKIISSDKENPVLNLNGDNVITIKKGEKFKEPGYTAIDNCDGNMTQKVKVIGTVNTKQKGINKLKYVIKDSTGNETIKYRTIYVTDKNTNNGIIYLTFDDGPSRDTTPVILDILKEEKISATFFVTDQDSSLDYLIKREDKEGHTVALHTATHNYSYVYSSVDAYFEDLKRVSDKVKRIIGKESKFIRFPGGSSNTVSIKYTPGIMTYLTEEVKRRGYFYYDWNVDSEDATRRVDENQVYNNVVFNLKPGCENIVLMHDFPGNEPTKQALRRIIKYGKENGYIFSSINEATVEYHHHINN